MGPKTAVSKQFLKSLFLIALLLPFVVVAQDNEIKAAVGISVEQEQEIWAGQQVTLMLDLKTTGFSFSNSHFNLPEISGAFLMQTDTTTIKLTDKIDGQDWQIVRYPLALYPQKSGRLEIPPINVRFTTSAGFGSAEKAFEFQTRPLELTVNLPAGAIEGNLLVTTTSFELDHDWQGISENIHTGDAITLTVTRRAKNISAMLLPPLPVYRRAGLAAYPQTPEVYDKTNRGDLTGERVDTIIWVVEKPGSYEIPGIRFQWWDPDSRELKQQIVPGQQLDILPSTSDTVAKETSAKSDQDSSLLLAMLMLVIMILLVRATRLRFGRKAHNLHLNNEKSAFTKLQKACKSNQAAQTHTAIHAWLATSPVEPGANSQAITLMAFAKSCNDQQLSVELERLQEVLVVADMNWQGAGLLRSIQRIRRKLNQEKAVQSEIHLAQLNP